jgi:hypothetical protein
MSYDGGFPAASSIGVPPGRKALMSPVPDVVVVAAA